MRREGPLEGEGEGERPIRQGSLLPPHGVLSQEIFLSGSDLLLLAAVETGGGLGTEPGGVLVLLGAVGSRCIGTSLINLEIPGASF